MNIVYKALNEIVPYANNPRKNDDAVDGVMASIKEFGFKVPIIIDKDGTIIAGHTRYKASLKLGLEEVPCIIADDLTEEQVKAFRLADNKVAERAEWDFDLLIDELHDIDIDMSVFGFDVTETEESEENDSTASVGLNESFQLIIEFDTEDELQDMYETMKAEGYRCRVSTL